jgi:hypothetical protein
VRERDLAERRVTSLRTRSALEALRWRLKRAPLAAEAAWRDGGGLRPPRELASHLLATVGWIEHAHDATGRKGVARSYSLVPHRRYARRGWLPAYPETTGYLIPTLLAAARHLGREELARRALEMAEWEAELQLESGAVRGGTVEDEVSPAVFNTGQVLFGWIAAHEATSDARFSGCATRAARWLVESQDEDGAWRRGASKFAAQNGHVYNARAAWALALHGTRTRDAAAVTAARRAADFALTQQRENGWFAENCLDDPAHPLLHTIAYAAQGVLEIGLLLDEPRFVEAARRAARGVAARVAADGALPGRLDAEWRAAAPWSCVTGEAQMVLVWDRLDALAAKAGARGEFQAAATAVLRHALATQDLDHREPGIRGGVAGSFPIWGDYGRYEYLNWAAKFLVDALLGRLAHEPGGTRG